MVAAHAASCGTYALRRAVAEYALLHAQDLASFPAAQQWWQPPPVGLRDVAGLPRIWYVVRYCSDSFKKDKDDDRHTARSVLNLDTSEGRELLRRLSSVSSGVSAPRRAAVVYRAVPIRSL